MCLNINFNFRLFVIICYFPFQTSKAYLERSMKESEENLRELVANKQRDR